MSFRKLTVAVAVGMVTVMLLGAPAGFGEETLGLSGILRDRDGQPVAGMEIAFFRGGADAWERRAVVTDEAGAWSIQLPAGHWRGAPNPEALLQIGYFCAPGIVFCLEPEPGSESGELSLVTDPNCPAWTVLPPEWNVSDPVVFTPITLPDGIELVAVPTTPSLSIDPADPLGVRIRLSYSVPVGEPTVIRQWRIERSLDLATWKAIATVPLSEDGAKVLIDSTATPRSAAYYRATQVEDLVPEN